MRAASDDDQLDETRSLHLAPSRHDPTTSRGSRGPSGLTRSSQSRP